MTCVKRFLSSYSQFAGNGRSRLREVELYSVPPYKRRLSIGNDDANATGSEARDLVNTDLREERMARMTPERRTLYDRIAKRREKAGAVEHDLVASLKELRDNG